MSSIRDLVDRGLRVHAAMAKLKKQLDEIETALEKAGLARDHEDLKDADREGRRWLAPGSKLVVPVIFTADKIIASFQDGTPKHTKIEKAAGNYLRDFYTRSSVWKINYDDGKKFRAKAHHFLGDSGPAFISACLMRDKHGIAKSDVKVAWADAEPVVVKS